MLQRFFIQIALVFVFALTQIGVATHEISHFSTAEKHSQHDKNTPSEQCGQCIAYTQVGSGLQSHAFALPTFDAHFQTASHYFFNALTSPHAAYAARAPPSLL
ncbi:MAG: hypothetical protein HOP21_02815 [Methylotenera sp.]|nr:hypothetical protein [Methylotenera sp.]